MAKVMTDKEFKEMLARGGVKHRVPKTRVYLSRRELAEHIGVAEDTLNRYTLPPADATIGKFMGWTVETINAWNDARPRRAVIR